METFGKHNIDVEICFVLIVVATFKQIVSVQKDDFSHRFCRPAVQAHRNVGDKF